MPAESVAPSPHGSTETSLLLAGGSVAEDNPLSSASLRYLVRHPALADRPGLTATRPLGLRHAEPVAPPARPEIRYCPRLQVAVDPDGRPLIETMGKDWKTKAASDGDEGPEEHYDWEEE